jgi:glycosyltransferase involved in cell wall biosynthesis
MGSRDAPRRLLILVEDYPSPQNLYAGAYVHTRVRAYLASGLDCTVLSFQARGSYQHEGVQVRSEADCAPLLRRGGFELVISHAPNLRNHLRFLAAERRHLPACLFFIHGHELLETRRYYPRPFAYDRRGRARRLLQALYDPLKLAVLRRLWGAVHRSGKVWVVFVSGWMRDASLRSLRLAPAEAEALLQHSDLIPNPAGEIFLEKNYQPVEELLADLVTIRPFDNPKYGVDLVHAAALANPELRFHLYGRGRYFQHHAPPANLTVTEGYVGHAQMPALLNRFRAALLPTRLDAQGVLMCELASYGIPLLTSDLPICREMLDGFPNVAYLPNDSFQRPLEDILSALRGRRPSREQKARFGFQRTLARELDLIEKLCAIES